MQIAVQAGRAWASEDAPEVWRIFIDGRLLIETESEDEADCAAAVLRAQIERAEKAEAEVARLRTELEQAQKSLDWILSNA